MMTDKILQKIQELETEIANANFSNMPDVKNKVSLMLGNLSKMEKMVLDIKEQAAIDNIMATHNCSREEAMFIHLNADGIDYVDISFFISKGQYGLIYVSRTKNVELNSVSRPRSSYVYWRLVNGKKEYIWKD